MITEQFTIEAVLSTEILFTFEPGREYLVTTQEQGRR